MLLTKKQVIIVATISIFIFFIVYTPHLSNPYPIHIDEWRHITEAIKLKQDFNKSGWEGIEIGFQIFLAFLSFFINLGLFYKFLPALWALVCAITLFFIAKKITSDNEQSFFISLFAMIFFASIKSNVNVTGLWFFTPLTFSIPFIFLYIYFFSQGIQEQNKKYILTSLVIMLILIPVHSISVLFAIPFLAIYLLINCKYLIKEYKFFLLFLLIPAFGLFFYSLIFKISLMSSFYSVISQLQFKKGWGVLEFNNSFLEMYSLVGYLLAIIGIVYIVSSKYNFKKYLIYIIWPLAVLFSIIIFKLIETSYLSPFQRNLYYFAISLPLLSSIGFCQIIKIIKVQINKTNLIKKEKIFFIIKVLAIILVLILTFKSYYTIPKEIKLYKIIDKENYNALIFLSAQQNSEESKVMAPLFISTAMYPVSYHEPVATIYFYGNSEDVDKFFEPNPEDNNCKTKNNLLEKYGVSYIFSDKPIKCGWEIIYNKTENIIYKR